MFESSLDVNFRSYGVMLIVKDIASRVGRNIQLDEGTGRQFWKCLDPLNCVASVAFRKRGTWVQTWTWNFWGTLHKLAIARIWLRSRA